MQQIWKKNEILHDKDCPYMVLMGDKEMSLTELIEWGKQYRCCKRCQRIVLVHSSIIDVENCEIYYNFFDRHQVSVRTLQNFFVYHSVRMEIVDDNIEIRCQEDTWRMPIRTRTGHVELKHNNYIKNVIGERCICEGYHMQKLPGRTVESALKYMMYYDYELFHGLDRRRMP